MLHRSIRGPASEESDRSSPVAGTGAHHAVVEAEEIKPFPADLQAHDPRFRFLRLQPEIGQQDPKPLQGSLGLFPRSTHHHHVIGLCRLPGYAAWVVSVQVGSSLEGLCSA